METPSPDASVGLMIIGTLGAGLVMLFIGLAIVLGVGWALAIVGAILFVIGVVIASQ